MKKKIRFASAALSLVMAASAAALPAAAAADEAQKDESVFVTLAPDGTVEKQTVSVWLHSDAGLAGFEDLSSLEDIRSLKGPETFTRQGERLVWQAEGSDVYYQGTTGRQLPVTAEIAYELDGTALSAEELLGRSGRLRVTIRLTNHETRSILADGRQRTICTPFAALLGTNLDADHFANITAEHGTVQADGANQMVGWVCLPGMAQSLDGLLVGSLADLQDKFYDEVSFEADVADCPPMSFIIACATDPDALSELDGAEELDGLSEDIGKLRDATDELLDGTAELLDGVIELHDAVSGELADGVARLDDSVSGELTDGVRELRDGLDTLAGNNDALSAGADQIVAAVFASATQQLNEKLAAAGVSVPALTPGNYRAVLGGVGQQLSANAVGIAKAKISASLDQALQQAAAGGVTLPAGVSSEAAKNAIVYLAAQGGVGGNVEDALKNAAGVLLAALGQQPGSPTPPIRVAPAAPEPTPIPETAPAPQPSTEPQTSPEPTASQTPAEPSGPAPTPSEEPSEPPAPEPAPSEEPSAPPASEPPAEPSEPEPAASALPEIPEPPAAEGLGVRRVSAAPAVSLLGSRAAAPALQPMAAGLDPTVLSILAGGSLDEAAAAWDTLAAAAAGSDKDMNAAAAQLQGLMAQLDGVVQFRSGLAQYTEGVASAASGGQKLYDAVTGDLAGGARELRDAVTGDLGDGVNELLNGVQELVDGVAEYDEEGISKITGREELDQLDALLDTADALRDASGSYRSYSGAPEGVCSTVKFVMRTREPEAPEGPETRQPAGEAAEPERVGFWQRLKNLFFGPKD